MSMKNGHNEDEEYFNSYADMSIHLDMIHDEVRTKTYRYAILKNYDVFFKKVVMDVGAGTGILSMFCVQAGASKVYAVEASDMAFEAKKVIKDNGMDDRIKVIKSKVEEVILDEKVDIIVSEWMGHLLFFESMLPSVLHARDKFLKEGGLMFPSVASISLAVLADEEVDMDGSNVWDTVKTSYSLNMNSLRHKSLLCFTERVHVVPVDPQHIVAFPMEILKVNLQTVSAESLKESLCESNFAFKSFGCTKVNGFCAFFDVTFRKNIVLSTSPYKELTHWSQSVMYLKNHIQVEQDDLIKGTISIRPSPNSRRGLSVHIEYSSLSKVQTGENVEGGPCQQTFVMDGLGISG